jgi:hypothetical protein
LDVADSVEALVLEDVAEEGGEGVDVAEAEAVVQKRGTKNGCLSQSLDVLSRI